MYETWNHIRELLADTQNWLLIGVILLGGHLSGKIAKFARMPSVVGYLIAGVLLGVSAFNIMDPETVKHLHLISDFGLGIVAFMIGTELSAKLMRKLGKRLFIIILTESIGAFLLVFGLVWLCVDLSMAKGAVAVATGLVFAAMAPASAPAGTVAVIHEYKAKGPLTSLLLAVVGLDDGLAIMIYAFAIAGVRILLGGGDLTVASIFTGPVLEIMGGLFVGALVGLILTYSASKTRSPAEILTLSLGAILLATGLANVLGFSLILSNLAVGMIMVNISSHDANRSYKAVKGVTHPVFILFFVLAGAHLDLHILLKLSLLAPVYIVGRIIGLMGGAWLGATISRAEDTVRKYLGMGILSQAGVAIGLALMVNRQLAGPGSPFGEEGKFIASMAINTIAATTIFFEVLGPIVTKIALARAGEIDVSKSD